MDQNSRYLIVKMKPVLFFFTIFGTEIILYSILINMHILPCLKPDHSWFDYFVLGIILLFVGFTILIFSIEDVQVLGKYAPLFLIFIIFGCFLELVSFFAYSKILNMFGIKKSVWKDLFFAGIMPIYIGGLPFSLYKIQHTTNRKYSISISAISLIVVGSLVYLSPTLALNRIILPMTIFNYNDYFDYLLFGSTLTLIGIIGITLVFYEFMRAKNVYLVVIFILGAIQIVLSMILLISDTYFIDLGLRPILENLSNLNGYSIFGMTWDVFFFNGLFTTLISLIIISLIIYLETLELDSQYEEKD